MIQFDYDSFCEWFASQRGGKRILDGLDRDQAHYLHDICNAFKDEAEHEYARLEHDLEKHLATESADAKASRKGSAKHEIADAVQRSLDQAEEEMC